MPGKDPYAQLPRYGPPVDLVSTLQQNLIVTDANVSGAAAINQTKLASAPACSVYASANGSVATGTWTVIGFDRVDYDPLKMYDGVNKFTIPISGRWAMNAWVDWAGSNSGMRFIEIVASGQAGVAGTAYADNASVANATFGHSQETHRVVLLTAGTALQVAVFHNSVTSPLATVTTGNVPASALASFHWMGF